jgi:integrase
MIKHVHIVKKTRVGKPPLWYVYAHRGGGPQIHRHEGWERPMLSQSALKKLLDAQVNIERVEHDTLGALARRWRPNSPEWKGLADNTKKTWGSALDRIEARWGETPLSVWNDPRMKRKVVDWRDSRSNQPRGADVGVQVLRALLEFACLRGLVEINVAKGVPQLYRGGNRAEIIWTEADLEAFAREASKQDKLHVLDAVRLAALTGLRREDLTTLTWGEVQENAIVKTAAKVSRGRRRRVTIPRLGVLDDLLQELRSRVRSDGVNSVLVNSRGNPWTPDGLNSAFNSVRDKVGIFHVDEDGTKRAKHMHDLRGTFCTNLIKAGLPDEQVADVMGWSPEQVRGIRRVYVDQGQIAVAIGERLRTGL